MSDQTHYTLPDDFNLEVFKWQVLEEVGLLEWELALDHTQYNLEKTRQSVNVNASFNGSFSGNSLPPPENMGADVTSCEPMPEEPGVRYSNERQSSSNSRNTGFTAFALWLKLTLLSLIAVGTGFALVPVLLKASPYLAGVTVVVALSVSFGYVKFAFNGRKHDAGL